VAPANSRPAAGAAAWRLRRRRLAAGGGLAGTGHSRRQAAQVGPSLAAAARLRLCAAKWRGRARPALPRAGIRARCLRLAWRPAAAAGKAAKGRPAALARAASKASCCASFFLTAGRRPGGRATGRVAKALSAPLIGAATFSHGGCGDRQLTPHTAAMPSSQRWRPCRRGQAAPADQSSSDCQRAGGAWRVALVVRAPRAGHLQAGDVVAPGGRAPVRSAAASVAVGKEQSRPSAAMPPALRARLGQRQGPARAAPQRGRRAGR
jgi:hypothetical protein